MFTLQTSFNHFCSRGRGVKSVSRGDCEQQGGKPIRLLSQLRPRIRPQYALHHSYNRRRLLVPSKFFSRRGLRLTEYSTSPAAQEKVVRCTIQCGTGLYIFARLFTQLVLRLTGPIYFVFCLRNRFRQPVQPGGPVQVKQDCRTGPPGYIGWRNQISPWNRFLGSLNVYKFGLREGGFVHTSADIFKQSMGVRNRVGIGLSYRPARL